MVGDLASQSSQSGDRWVGGKALRAWVGCTLHLRRPKTEIHESHVVVAWLLSAKILEAKTSHGFFTAPCLCGRRRAALLLCSKINDASLFIRDRGKVIHEAPGLTGAASGNQE
jgi:hypothetical protein